MDDITKMNLHNLREHISNLEFRRDKIGCGKDVIDRLNAARTELSSRNLKRTRPVFQIKACCLICARGEPEGGTVRCTYSQEAYREGWYCGLFMLRDIETGLE